MLRPLVEAAQVTLRSSREWCSQYLRLMMRRGRRAANVAVARRLAILLFKFRSLIRW